MEEHERFQKKVEEFQRSPQYKSDAISFYENYYANYSIEDLKKRLILGTAGTIEGEYIIIALNNLIKIKS